CTPSTKRTNELASRSVLNTWSRGALTVNSPETFMGDGEPCSWGGERERVIDDRAHVYDIPKKYTRALADGRETDLRPDATASSKATTLAAMQRRGRSMMASAD